MLSRSQLADKRLRLPTASIATFFICFAFLVSLRIWIWILVSKSFLLSSLDHFCSFFPPESIWAAHSWPMLFKVQLHCVVLNNAFCSGPDSFLAAVYLLPSLLRVSGPLSLFSARQKITQDSLSGMIAQVWWFQSVWNSSGKERAAHHPRSLWDCCLSAWKSELGERLCTSCL